MRTPFKALFGLVVAVVPMVVAARSGGGEHYVSDHSSDGGGGGGGDDGLGQILYLLIRLCFEYPKVGIPLLIVFCVAVVVTKRNRDPGVRTQRAFQRAEAERPTVIAPSQLQAWRQALQQKDPAFDFSQLDTRARTLFVQLQEAWFRRDLTPVRPFLSDATWQRLAAQLDLLAQQGVRDAIADVQVLDVALAGVEQNDFFDTVHLRIKAQMRDTDVPATASDDEARRAAQSVAPEPFVEIWSFVRKPGAQTKVGHELMQGRCPNCGAPFSGGAANNCEYCGAIVNSGNYDWTLSEITQGIEHLTSPPIVEGLAQARATDPALNLEMLEDRTSLIFWKWIRAQSHNEPRELMKLASPELLETLRADLERVQKAGRRYVFLECAVGSVAVRSLQPDVDGRDVAHVELRWSAKIGAVPVGTIKPALPTVPQRWVFTLIRKAGASTNAERGMATSRCPSCGAPLTDSLTAQCDFCNAELGTGAGDWVLAQANPWERWRATQRAPAVRPIVDVGERTRLLQMMATVAAADGVVDDKERHLLQMCASRWSVPWSAVEPALHAQPGAGFGTVTRATPEAATFLGDLVNMAFIDGKIDAKERRLLESAARHLGVAEKLPALLARTN